MPVWGQSWEDWLIGLVQKKAEAEVVQNVRKIMQNPSNHFAPARKQLRTAYDAATSWASGRGRKLPYNQLRDELRAAGASDKEIDNYYFENDKFGPTGFNYSTPYSKERHDALFHVNRAHGNFKHDDIKSFAYDDFESVPARQKDIYHAGAAQYNFGRRRNLSRRAANRQAIIRLSRGRYH